VSAPREAIVVSGASTGIGAASAERLARDGFLVFAGVRTDTDAAAVEALHPNVRALRLDVTDDASIEAAVTTVAEAGLAVRGLVNNAGIAVGGPVEFLPLALWRRVYDVNLFGAIGLTQAFLPLLRTARGRLVFVGSVGGRMAAPFVAPYSSSKFALRALADALRVELRSTGIRVVLIEPGGVKTPIWRKGRDAKQELLERVSDVIAVALTSPKPRANYLVGIQARGGSILALMPAAFRERAIRRSMRLP
jgi:NAD(P)-dependent dehydrogenase (short-subunit alcohol dehydrogenase family)